MEPMATPDDLNAEVARRLPLAESTLRLLDYAMDETFVAGVFERHRGRCFERELRFPVFVSLMSDAILGHQGSAHQTFQLAQHEGNLPTTVRAVYDRLATIPCQLSVGFFNETAARLDAVGVCARDSLPASLKDYRPLAFDGKKLKYVLKRLQPLRGLKGNVYGGKLLVVQDMATGRAMAVEATPDGEAADNPLVPGAVARARSMPGSRPRLWVADRAFGDFKTLHLLSEGDDDYVIRHSQRGKFYSDPTIPVRTGVDDVGREYSERWGWLGAPTDKRRIRVRMIEVVRTNDSPLMLVTSLLDADRHPAVDLLILYRRRWGIEVMFQRVVQTFDLRHLIGGTSEATVFQAIFCLLLYNVTLIVRDTIAEGAKRSPESVSSHLLHEDIVGQLTGWMMVIGAAATVDFLKARTFQNVEQFRRYLNETLGHVWTDRWAKAKTTKRPPRKVPRAYLRGGHSSSHRICNGTHKEIPLKPRKQS
jgi:hypothetical protein